MGFMKELLGCVEADQWPADRGLPDPGFQSGGF
jgi:hypothetical protein